MASYSGRVDHQWRNPASSGPGANTGAGGLNDVVEENRSEISFEQHQAPQHPITTMQGAFEESMKEDAEESPLARKDPVHRRKILLERPQYQRVVGSKWSQKPGEMFHPLWKIVAQLSFGMHLLHQELAKSDDEVIKILQGHVDEVDGFLERTTEDFDLAQHDINERIRYLQLPLEHGDVFDSMLMDRSFRTAMVDGNVKIEHIVERTSVALVDSLKDVKKGSDGTKELARYLRKLEKTWRGRDETITEVFQAMMGNTEGWAAAYQDIQDKGKTLQQSLEHLRSIIAEIQRLVGIASRRDVPQAFTPPETDHNPFDNEDHARSITPTRAFHPDAEATNEQTTTTRQLEGEQQQQQYARQHESETDVEGQWARNRSPSTLHPNAIIEEEDEHDYSPPRRKDADAAATHSKSQEEEHGRLTPKPYSRSGYSPQPDVIEEEDEESDGSDYTVDIIDATPITTFAPQRSLTQNVYQRSASDSATKRIQDGSNVPDYTPPKIEFHTGIPKIIGPEVLDESKKDFVLPPLDLGGDSPLPALTPLDYERMKAKMQLPSFDLKVPEEYANEQEKDLPNKNSKDQDGQAIEHITAAAGDEESHDRDANMHHALATESVADNQINNRGDPDTRENARDVRGHPSTDTHGANTADVPTIIEPDQRSQVDNKEPIPASSTSSHNAADIGISSAAVNAANLSSSDSLPSLTKQPRQLPIDDLLMRLRHGEGLVTPTEPLTYIPPHDTDREYHSESEMDGDELVSPRAHAGRSETSVTSHEQVRSESQPPQPNAATQPINERRAVVAVPAISTGTNKVAENQSVTDGRGVVPGETPSQTQSKTQSQIIERRPAFTVPMDIPVRPQSSPVEPSASTHGQPQQAEQTNATTSQQSIANKASVPLGQPTIVEPALRRRASYSDNRKPQKPAALDKTAFLGGGLLSPDSIVGNARQYPQTARVPSSGPWTFFSKEDMDHSYRRRRAHSLYSPSTPYDLEWLLRRTPSDATVSPMRWSDIYSFKSGNSSTIVSPLGAGQFATRSPPFTAGKQDVTIDSVLNSEPQNTAKSPVAPTDRPRSILIDLAIAREQVSQAAEIKPIIPVWRESTPVQRPQKADRSAVRASSIYSKAPDGTAVFSPAPDIPQIIRTETGYTSHYPDELQPSSAYTNLSFGQISPAPAISSAKPSPLHFVPKARIPSIPASPSSSKEEPKFPLEISDEKHTIVEVPPISPSLKSLTSATVNGPEPDFPFLTGSWGGPEPEYYYPPSMEDPEEASSKHPEPESDRGTTTSSEVSRTNHHQHQGSDFSQHQRLQPPVSDDYSTTYRPSSQQSQQSHIPPKPSKRREGPPPALNLSLFPSMDNLSRAAASGPRSPRSPRLQDTMADPIRNGGTVSASMVPTPNNNLLALPPLSQDPLGPMTAGNKPGRSPLKKLFKSALRTSILKRNGSGAGNVASDKEKTHRRGRSSVENPFSREVTIANAQLVGGPSPTPPPHYGLLSGPFTPGPAGGTAYGQQARGHAHKPSGSIGSMASGSGSLRPDYLMTPADGRRPSGERSAYGTPGGDEGRPF